MFILSQTYLRKTDDASRILSSNEKLILACHIRNATNNVEVEE